VEVIIMMYKGVGVVELDSVFDELNKKSVTPHLFHSQGFDLTLQQYIR